MRRIYNESEPDKICYVADVHCDHCGRFLKTVQAGSYTHPHEWRYDEDTLDWCGEDCETAWRVIRACKEFSG